MWETYERGIEAAGGNRGMLDGVVRKRVNSSERMLIHERD
jgi:hypothetical protein